jgi:hypothetical protein
MHRWIVVIPSEVADLYVEAKYVALTQVESGSWRGSFLRNFDPAANVIFDGNAGVFFCLGY